MFLIDVAPCFLLHLPRATTRLLPIVTCHMPHATSPARCRCHRRLSLIDWHNRIALELPSSSRRVCHGLPPGHPAFPCTSCAASRAASRDSSVVAQITTQPQLVVADPNGNHDSGYAASNVDDVLAGVSVGAAVSSTTPPDSPVPSGATFQRSSVSSRRNTAEDSPKRGEPAIR